MRKLKKLERVLAPPEDEPIILIEIWRPEQRERFIEEVKEAAEKLKNGQKIVVVPQGGSDVLKKWGIV